MTISLKRTPWAVPFLMLALLLVLMPETASAHAGTGGVGGFVSGFKHPLTGLDHVVAMVAVGLWGAFLGGQAIRIQVAAGLNTLLILTMRCSSAGAIL